VPICGADRQRSAAPSGFASAARGIEIIIIARTHSHSRTEWDKDIFKRPSHDLAPLSAATSRKRDQHLARLPDPEYINNRSICNGRRGGRASGNRQNAVPCQSWAGLELSKPDGTPDALRRRRKSWRFERILRRETAASSGAARCQRERNTTISDDDREPTTCGMRRLSAPLQCPTFN
jgi:hypothetical protein